MKLCLTPCRCIIVLLSLVGCDSSERAKSSGSERSAKTKSPSRDGSGPLPVGQREGKVQSPKVVVGPLVFEGEADVEWARPPRGKASEIHLELRITNTGSTPVRVALIDNLSLRLRPVDGSELKYLYARDFTSNAAAISPPLPPGQSLVLSRPGRLEWQEDGSLRLSGTDVFGGTWWFDGLRDGRYLLGFEYENREDTDDNVVRPWCGKAETPRVAVSIH